MAVAEPMVYARRTTAPPVTNTARGFEDRASQVAVLVRAVPAWTKNAWRSSRSRAGDGSRWTRPRYRRRSGRAKATRVGSHDHHDNRGRRHDRRRSHDHRTRARNAGIVTGVTCSDRHVSTRDGWPVAAALRAWR